LGWLGDISTPEPLGDLRPLRAEVSYVMVNLMKSVVSRGPARWALQIGRPADARAVLAANLAPTRMVVP
jgi:hypothetical protein